MENQGVWNWLCLATIFIIAVVLDIYFVRGRHRYRQLRREYDDVRNPKRDSQLFSLQTFWITVKKFLPPHWIWFLLSLLSVAYGDYLIEKRDPIGAPLLQAQLWNAIYKLEIVNFNNVLIALPYLLFGCTVLMWIAFPDEWKKYTEQNLPWLKHTAVDRVYAVQRIIIIGAGLIFLLVKLGEHQDEPFFPILWLILILWSSKLFWEWDKRSKIDLSFGITRGDLAWMLGLFAVTLAFGSYILWDLPKILISDEGAFWETARAIATGELHPSFFDFGVYTFPMASSIYQGWVMRLFGINIWGWRFSSVLAAAVTIIPLYLLGREWFNRRVAIAACLLMAVNPYFLSFARLGYNNSQALFPVTLCVFFFVHGLRNRSYFYWWLAGLAAGLGYYTFFSAWLGPVIIFLSIIIIAFIRKISLQAALKALVIILTGWLIMASPRLAYGLSGNQKDSFVYKIFEASFVNAFYGKTYYPVNELTDVKPFIPIASQNPLFFEPQVYKELLERGAVRTLLSPLDPYIINEHFLVTGLAGAITPVFFLIGLGLSLRGIKQSRFQIMLLWLSSGMLFLSILESFPPRHPQMVSLQPVLALFGGVGLIATIEALTNEFPEKNKTWKIAFSRGLILIGLATATVVGLYKYYVQMPNSYPPSFEDIASWITWKAGLSASILYIQDSPNQSRVAYVVNSKMASGSYDQTQIADFLSYNFKLPDAELQHVIAFFPADPNGKITARLRQILPGKLDLATFYDMNHNILGYVMTNTTVQLQPDASLSEGILSIIDTPALILILLALIASATFALWDIKGSWPHTAILTSVQREPCQPIDNSKVKFSIRIDIPHKKPRKEIS